MQNTFKMLIQNWNLFWSTKRFERCNWCVSDEVTTMSEIQFKRQLMYTCFPLLSALDCKGGGAANCNLRIVILTVLLCLCDYGWCACCWYFQWWGNMTPTINTVSQIKLKLFSSSLPRTTTYLDHCEAQRWCHNHWIE